MLGINLTKNTFSSNKTAAIPLASWTLVPIFQLSCNIISLLANSFVLYLFVRNRSQITPFQIYLIWLLVFNILNSLMCGPLDVFRGLFETWWISPNWCTFTLGADTTVEGILSAIHVGISANRIWAIYFPAHYRQHNTKKLALIISAGMYAPQCFHFPNVNASWRIFSKRSFFNS